VNYVFIYSFIYVILTCILWVPLIRVGTLVFDAQFSASSRL